MRKVKGYSKYTYQTRCDEDFSLSLGDETVKIVLNTKGSQKGLSKDLQAFIQYLRTNEVGSTKFIEDLDEAVEQVKSNREWRERYMTLEEKYQDYLQLGQEEGIKLGREVGEKEGAKQMLERFIFAKQKEGLSKQEIEKELRGVFALSML